LKSDNEDILIIQKNDLPSTNKILIVPKTEVDDTTIVIENKKEEEEFVQQPHEDYTSNMIDNDLYVPEKEVDDTFYNLPDQNQAPLALEENTEKITTNDVVYTKEKEDNNDE
jgi:hypothetical protein